MPMDAMIIPLNARRQSSANAAPSFDASRHLAIEPPAWTVMGNPGCRWPSKAASGGELALEVLPRRKRPPALRSWTGRREASRKRRS